MLCAGSLRIDVERITSFTGFVMMLSVSVCVCALVSYHLMVNSHDDVCHEFGGFSVSVWFIPFDGKKNT